jgi:hypothetical protein
LAVREGYISPERYAGTLPQFAGEFSRFHQTVGMRLGLQFGTATIRNNTVTAQANQGVLGISYLYPIGAAQVFGQSCFFYAGPTAEIVLHQRQQNIVASGFPLLSVGAMFSAGGRVELVYPLTQTLTLESAFQTSLLSFGFRFPFGEQGAVQFLTAFNGLHGSFDAALRYRITDALSVKLGYRAQTLWMGSWSEALTAGSDNVVASVMLHF